MKRIVLCLSFVTTLWTSQSFGQCDSQLSKEGYAHWRAAEVLMGLASTAADYEQVAIEYKQVVDSDPYYAPVYMQLGKLYAQLCEEKGIEAYEKAKYYFERCRTVCEDSTDAVNVELAILNALQRRRVDKFVGVWGKYWDVNYSPYVEISHDGREYIFRPLCVPKGGQIERVEKTETGFIYTFRCPPEYKETIYQSECNYQADNGYPTSGIYRYDKIIASERMFIAIEGDRVVEKGLSRHNDMYLGNRKVYAETINYYGNPEPLVRKGSKRPVSND